MTIDEIKRLIREGRTFEQEEPIQEDLCRLYILWGENRGPTAFPTSRCGFGVVLEI